MEQEKIPKTYAEAVGGYLRSMRSKHGLTLDNVAAEARKYGATWDQSSIRRIESGKAAPTLPTLLTLGVTLSSLLDDSITLRDLLGDAELLDMPKLDGAGASRAWVDDVLEGYGTSPPEPEYPRTPLAEDMYMVPTGEVLEHKFPFGFFQVLGGTPVVTRPATMAEQRAAQKLSISTYRLGQRALSLWGRPLEEESELRAESRAFMTGKPVTPQLRGAMTRELLRELEDFEDDDGEHPEAS